MNSPSNFSWRDRLGAAAVYLVPLMEGLSFGSFLFRQFPILQVLFIPLIPVIQLYNAIPFGRLILFFVLFFAVVRNDSLSRFVRFNGMQAVLLTIILSISSLILSLFGSGLQSGAPLLLETLVNTLFLATVAAVGFSLVQCLRGEYPELPGLSDAANSQVF
jgi:uncharacterized membrane protein